MARKEEIIKVRPQRQPRRSFFPTKRIIFGLFAIALAVYDGLVVFGYLTFFDIPRIVLDIFLLITGYFLFKHGLEMGFSLQRKSIFMKHI